MRKKILFLSIVCLLFITLSYTYSSFKSSIVGNINGNIKDWVFKVSVDNGTIEDGGYKLHLSGTSGSFNVNINTTNGIKDANYTIELIGDNSIKYYTDSSYSTLITNNIYSGGINSNTNGSVTIYYKSDTNIDSDIIIKTKGNIMEYATMKNGYLYDEVNRVDTSTEFWNKNYRKYIKNIEFGNNLSNIPSSCTEANLCWDITESGKEKVYAYLIDSGEVHIGYNLYIVSNGKIFAPTDCKQIFYGFLNLISIDFNNNNFNTSNVINMSQMFYNCSSLTNIDLSNFNTSNVTDMTSMFESCSSLTNLDLSNFNTSNVINMSSMFYECRSLTNIDLSKFNTSNVANMGSMFYYCKNITNLDLSNFNTSKVTNMNSMFYSCYKLITTINIMNSNVTKYSNMFYNAATEANTLITVNYIASASTLVDKMIATKTSNNVVKGSQI